jgi:hypothetical protein
MVVEYPYPAGAGIAEAMLDVTWRREERARAAATPLAVNEKLDLTLDDVRRVGVIRVSVRINTLPAVTPAPRPRRLCLSQTRLPPSPPRLVPVPI